MRKFLFPLIVLGMSLFALFACKNQAVKQGENSNALHGDSALNSALRFYAGISREGVQMNDSDARNWDVYSDSIKYLLKLTADNRRMVDSIAANDFKDFRDTIDYVFYPFSGADFIYPTTIFPDADTYFLCGLEKTGKPIGDAIDTNFAHYDSYRQALTYFFSASYFITRRMHTELHNTELDGVCPIITMLMATAEREVLSVKQKTMAADGTIADVDSLAPDSVKNVIEIKFCRTGSDHEQTLYYMSCNVLNEKFNPGLKQYLSATLPRHRVATYLKAASYLLHYGTFSTMHDFVLDNSLAVIGDDSGIRYKDFLANFDVTLYGHYQQPLPCFGRECYQPDLQDVYDQNPGKIHPLPFRIGYNDPSNWLCARRKK